MYCKYCGREENNHAEDCVARKAQPVQSNEKGQTKRPIGFMFCFFFGLLGLIMGLLMYEQGSYERYTFKKGWLACFVMSLIIALIIGLVAGIALIILLPYLGAMLAPAALI